MNSNSLTFVVHDKTYFTIILHCPDNIIHACDFSSLNLTLNNKIITIGKSIIDDYAQVLKNNWH